MKIEIKCRFSGKVLFEHDVEGNTMRLTLEAAVSARANLRGANLGGANLGGADLDGANLYGANLRGANLRGANLRGANLRGANLDGADLRGANLDGADLDGETLSKPPLSLVNLEWSVLITEQYMRIGCQRHKHEKWAEFDDTEIGRMADGALDFWCRWKAPLLVLCDRYRRED